MESFLLEVPGWNSSFVVYNENYVGLQVLERKKIHDGRIMLLKVPSFVLLSKHMCHTTTMAWTSCIFHMHLFKRSVDCEVNKLPLSDLWELMVDGKKSVLSRILVVSSLPHSREFKRLSTSLFLLSLQSSAVGDVKLCCYYQ